MFTLNTFTLLFTATQLNYPAVAGTHCIYPRMDGQAELTWMVGYPAEVGDLFTAVSSIRVSRVRVTLTVTVRVSRVSVYG